MPARPTYGRIGLPVAPSATLSRFVVAALLLAGRPITALSADPVMVFGDSLAHQLALAAPDVMDAGVPSERLSSAFRDIDAPEIASGEQRIGRELAARRPKVVLIVQGTNDVLEAMYQGKEGWMDYVSVALVRVIDECHRAGVERVIVATIPPQRSTRLRDRQANAAQIQPLNERLRSIARAAGAEVFDLHALVSSDLESYLSEDGLHLTDAANAMAWQALQPVIRAMSATVVTP